jgi:hypothetical protein
MSSSFYLKVDVISDSIQTVGGAVEARWNAVQINGKKLEKKQAEDSSENAGEEETAKEAENTAEEKDS